MSEKQSQPADPQGAESKSEEAATTEQEGAPEQEYEDEVHDIMTDFQVTDQLDSRLAMMEEQFRKSFDERLGAQNPKKQFWEDEVEMMRSSKILREASRGIGDEWQPIFIDLMAKFPPEVIEAEKVKLEKQQPIIQGYKALTVWKEHMGPNYTAMLLVDVLRKHNMDDLADEILNILDSFDEEIKADNKDKDGKKDKKKEDKKDRIKDHIKERKKDKGDVKEENKDDKKDDENNKEDSGKSEEKKPGKGIQRKKSDAAAKAKQGILDNRRLLLLAKKIGNDWEPLGKALGVPEEELSEIREGEDGKTYQGAFKVLWSWRQTQPGNETEEIRNILKAALEKVGKKGLLEEFEAK